MIIFVNHKRKFSKNKKFTLIHKAGIKDTDLKCEIFYPFLDALFTTPFVIVCYNILATILPDSMRLNLFAYYLEDTYFLIKVFFTLLLLEICLYIKHRFSHEFMWSFNAIHHCAYQMTWITSLRGHPIDAIVMALIQYIIIFTIGISFEAYSVSIGIFLFWNAFEHANINLDFLKPLKYIIGSLNFHRWHHATDTEAHNKNYCNMFAFIDYIMGTYYCPDNRLPKKYGCSIKTLDDYKNTNILKELYYPIGRQFKKIAKFFAKVNIRKS